MKKFISSLLIFSLAFIGYISLPTEAYAESTIEQVKKRKVLRVAFSTFVPWAMQTKSGEFIGFEIDVATRLAKDLGVRIQPQATAWSGIIPALLANKADVIIGGMGVTEERKKQVDFTIAYDKSRLEILANIEKSKDLKTPADFNNPNVIIIARTGATPATAIKELFPNATLRFFADEAPCVEEVLSGRAHAFVSSAPLPAFAVVENPDKLFIPFEITEYQEDIAFAVRKNDPETLKVFNEWIEKVKAEGWLQERVNYWFKTKDWEEK